MLCLVVALQCEAKPLIRHYRLRARSTAQSFRIYGNDDTTLIISGVGKAAAAAAVAYLHMHNGQAVNHAWLNWGVAGHGEWAVGTGFIAHKITDQGSSRHWYPPLLADLPCPTDALITVDSPARHFAAPAGYDMEAAGYYPTACRFATSELVQCYKIVSDDVDSAGDRLSAQQVSALMADHVPVVESVAAGLREQQAVLAGLAPEDALLSACLRQWRFSTTQRHQLARLCQRARALALDADACWHELQGSRDAGQVLSALNERLARTPPRLG